MHRTALKMLLIAVTGAGAASAETIYVSTTTNLMTFDSANPATITSNRTVVGLLGGSTLEGIDFRPATGELYAIDNIGQLYRIDPQTAVATPIGEPAPVAGTRFGIDFDPTTDRIRVVSNSGANVRRHPDTGVVEAADQTLAYAPGDPFFGEAASVSAAAYSNNLAGATTTVLYDLEATVANLTRQAPVGEGTLHTVGALDLPITSDLAGFDIRGDDDHGFAVFDGGLGTSLYEIDLGNGRATFRGGLAGSPQITGLAIAPSEGPCLPTATALCLQNDRIRVTATWSTPGGDSGPAAVVALSDESGFMTFFDPSNLEGSIKVIDGCSNNGFFWVFASGLTNLEVAISVVDLLTGEEFPIANPQGRLFSTVASIEALPCD